MLQRLFLLLLIAFVAAAAAAREPRQADTAQVEVVRLPVEARETLALIKRGGPFPYRKDGAVFGNFEQRLPARPRGYYREYTVPTPAARNRGARRIVAGRDGVYYYTDDHYRTFKRIPE